MTKFSLFGDEDDGQEGPSSSGVRKRSRFTLLPSLSDEEDEPIPSLFPHRPPENHDDDDDDDDEYEDDDQIQVDEESNHDSEEAEEENRSQIEIDSVLDNPDGEDYEPVGENSDKSISVSLTDPDVLDCCICFEPLTIPVFQCENGHIACSSCCTKIRNKCPSCSWPIGYNRCRAIEKVLESVKIACQNKDYGCKETVIYSSKKDHEKSCAFSPRWCPFTDCNFMSSCEPLYAHFSANHPDSAVKFSYNHHFNATLAENVDFLVLQEKNDGVLFIINRNVEPLGSVVWLSCVSHSETVKKFNYDISAKFEAQSLTLKSSPKASEGQVDNFPPHGFILVPPAFLSPLGNLYLGLCIFDNRTV